MTYEEYIDLFSKLKTNNYNKELLETLKKTPLNTNIQDLLIDKYYEVIIYKFSASIHKLKDDLYTIFSDVNYLDMYLVNFKKEIKYLEEMININILPQTKKDELKTLIKDETTKTYEILLKEANREDPKGIYALTIKNNTIKWSDNNEL